MRPYHRVDVQLSKKDRKQIAGMLNKGRESARVLRRALLLRQLDQGQTAAQVARNLAIASKAVIIGVVTDGWLEGNLVQGEYTQKACPQGTCYQGTLDILRGSKSKG